MKYLANSFEIEVPDGYIDRSNHILMLSNKGLTGSFNVVVTRDELPSGVGLEKLVDTQVRAVEKSQKKYRETQEKRSGHFKNEDGIELLAYEVGFSYESQGKPVSQRLVFMENRPQEVLIIAGTLSGVWTDAHQKAWLDILNGLKLIA